MQVSLVADAQADSNWWFAFVDKWGNSATVISFVITLIGFIITWKIQWRLRSEIKKVLLKVAKQALDQSLNQLQFELKMVKEHVGVPSWRRALDCCVQARDIALRTRGNPHLNETEKVEMLSHADNLAQIRDYIRANKLGPDPPAVFQQQKYVALEAMITFVTAVQVRLEATIWEG